MQIAQLEPNEIERAITLLLLAEPSEPALRWGLKHLSDAVYGMQIDGELVGAATMQWRDDPCEIEEIAIVPDHQGQGLGRVLIDWLLDAARQRGKRAMLVGTPSASIGNIAFYQRVGFRADHVRQNYFRYYRPPRYENGIQILDMIVFRREL